MSDHRENLWRMKDAMESNSGGCAHCGDDDEFSPNVEAFEICGELLCDDCAEEIFEENGQFGAGA